MGYGPADMRRFEFLAAIAFLLTAAHSTCGQDVSTPLPQVISHQNPIYPPLARMARISGLVRLKITTDGHSPTTIAVTDGHPLLAKAATDNVQTWKFADHVPGVFKR